MQTVPSESPEQVQESGLESLHEYLYSNAVDGVKEYRLSVINATFEEIHFRIYPFGMDGKTLDFVLGQDLLLPGPEQAANSSDTAEYEGDECYDEDEDEDEDEEE